MKSAGAVGHDRRAPAVPRGHVGGQGGERLRQAALPQQPEIREEHRFVESHRRELRRSGRRFPVLRGKRVVVGVLGRQLLAAALSVATDGSGVPGQLHVGQDEPTVSPGEPGIAQLVVDDGQGLIGEVRVDVVGPQRPALEEVLVRVDDGAHRDQCN